MTGLWLKPMKPRLPRPRKTRPRARAKNRKFVALVERDGHVRSTKLTGKGPGAIASQVRKVLRENMDEASTLHTDGAQHAAKGPGR